MLSLIAVDHGYLNTQIYTTNDVNNNNYLYRDILCRCDMLVITTKTRVDLVSCVSRIRVSKFKS